MNSHHDDGGTPVDGFVVGEHWVGRTVVITAAGDLDMLTAPALAAAIAAATRKDRKLYLLQKKKERNHREIHLIGRQILKQTSAPRFQV